MDVFTLYLGFLVVFVWRVLVPCSNWKKGWQRYFNYFTMLYMLLFLLLVYEAVMLAMAVYQDPYTIKDAYSEGAKGFLRHGALGTPLAVGITFLLAFGQSQRHVAEINDNHARELHEMALGILACPVVFAVMALAGITKVYPSVMEEMRLPSAAQSADFFADQDVVVAAFETCVAVADAYEAFTLYQFGVLTVTLLERSFAPHPGGDKTTKAIASSSSSDPPEGAGMQAQATVSFIAVADVMWTGVFLFIVVAMLQSGWGIFLWVFEDLGNKWNEYQYSFDNFSTAGLIASCGALYNVHVVEHTFGEFIAGYSPLLKFISVKLMVWFTCWQFMIVWLLSYYGYISLTPLQTKLLYAELLAYEALLLSLLHTICWRVTEDWYSNFDEGEILPISCSAMDAPESSSPSADESSTGKGVFGFLGT